MKVEPVNCEHCGILLLEIPKNNQCPECHKFIGKKTFKEFKREPKLKELPKEEHIKLKNGKEYIIKIIINKYPCQNCVPDLQEECKRDLKKGLKIEFERKNNVCFTDETKLNKEE